MSTQTCEIPDIESWYEQSSDFTDLAGNRPPHLTEAELGVLAIEREDVAYKDMPGRDPNDGTPKKLFSIVLSVN